MDEVKIWAVEDAANVTLLASKGQTESELLLEEVLVKNPDLLIPGLMIVGRQMPTDGGPLDLLGVDEDSRLVVFELKRGTLSRDAVAQIIDYASDLDSKDDAALAEHIAAHSGVRGIEKIDDFEEWYVDNTEAESLDSLRPMRLFLVGLGADDRTERMVRFLAGNGDVDISLLTFHGFAYDGKTLLARQMEVEGNAEPDRRPRRQHMSAEQKLERLERLIEDSRVPQLFDTVKAMFEKIWPKSSQLPTVRHGLSIRLRRQPQSGKPVRFARIDPQDGEVRIVFFPLAKRLCLDQFSEPVNDIRHQTHPANGEPLEERTEIQFLLNPAEWEIHKERLYTLTQAVYEAWESRDHDEDSA